MSVGRLALSLFGLFVCVCHANAGQVRLSAENGSLSVEGEFKHFDGEYFHLSTEEGPIVVLAQNVNCTGDVCPKDASTPLGITFHGPDDILQNLMPKLLARFRLQEGLKIESSLEDGSVNGISFLSQASDKIAIIDLQTQPSLTQADTYFNFEVATGLTPRNGEQTASLEQSSPLTFTPRQMVLAYDALIPVTSLENPVSSILQQDLLQILSGEITNWSEIGGPDLPIRLFFTRNFKEQLHAAWREDPNLNPARMRFASSGIIDAISSDTGLLGLVPYRYVEGLKQLELRDNCGFSHLASPFSIEAGQYPLSFGYSLTQPFIRPPLLLRKWERFLRSSTAHDIIDQSGFVSSKPTVLSLEEQGSRLTRSLVSADPEVSLSDLKRLARILTEADRLSTTFRVGKIDRADRIRTISDADALIEFIRTSDMSSKKLVFLGFSDNSGDAATNVKLSFERAKEVRELVLNLAIDRGIDMPPAEALGLGEASPVGCNETTRGRRLNRRVELWIKDRGD